MSEKLHDEDLVIRMDSEADYQGTNLVAKLLREGCCEIRRLSGLLAEERAKAQLTDDERDVLDDLHYRLVHNERDADAEVLKGLVARLSRESAEGQ